MPIRSLNSSLGNKSRSEKQIQKDRAKQGKLLFLKENKSTGARRNLEEMFGSNVSLN